MNVDACLPHGLWQRQLVLPGPRGLFARLRDGSLPVLLRVKDFCTEKRPGALNGRAGCTDHSSCHSCIPVPSILFYVPNSSLTPMPSLQGKEGPDLREL